MLENISCLSQQGKATTPDPTAKEEDSTTLQIFQLQTKMYQMFLATHDLAYIAH